MAETKTAAINTLGAGSIFNYGGIRWILLEHARNAALCLAADLLPDEKPFDAEGNNDWAGSSLRAYLNGDFMKELVAAGADADAFVEMVVDLTSDDGLDDYGTDRCKIALISDAQYRRFRKIIHNADNWWWTITPFSTAKNGYSRNARNVDTSGALDNSSARNGDNGVRPLCNLKSSIMVSFDPEEATNNTESEGHDEQHHRAEALDMMRHIIAAWDVKPEEMAALFGTNEDTAEPENEPESVEPPEIVKSFMREVLGMPEEMVNAARAKKMPNGGFGIEIEAVEADEAAATAEDLRAGLVDLIETTHAKFENSGCGFDPACFTALVNAYGVAITAAKEGGE